MPIHHGINLREVVQHAKRLGATTWKKDGHIFLRHSDMNPRQVYQNCRRKDATREVTAWVMQLEALFVVEVEKGAGILDPEAQVDLGIIERMAPVLKPGDLITGKSTTDLALRALAEDVSAALADHQADIERRERREKAKADREAARQEAARAEEARQEGFRARTLRLEALTLADLQALAVRVREESARRTIG